MSEQYDIASKLALDLAEDVVQSDAANMMKVNSRDIAKTVRRMSEDNIKQLSSKVQQFRQYESAIYSAVWSLLDGYGGYILKPVDKDSNTGD